MDNIARIESAIRGLLQARKMVTIAVMPTANRDLHADTPAARALDEASATRATSITPVVYRVTPNAAINFNRVASPIVVRTRSATPNLPAIVPASRVPVPTTSRDFIEGQYREIRDEAPTITPASHHIENFFATHYAGAKQSALSSIESPFVQRLAEKVVERGERRIMSGYQALKNRFSNRNATSTHSEISHVTNATNNEQNLSITPTNRNRSLSVTQNEASNTDNNVADNRAISYSETVNDNRREERMAQDISGLHHDFNAYAKDSLTVLAAIRDAIQASSNDGDDGFDLDFRRRGRGRGGRGRTRMRSPRGGRGSRLSRGLRVGGAGGGIGAAIRGFGSRVLSLGRSAATKLGKANPYIAAALFGGTGLNAAINAYQGKDSHNWISDIGDKGLQWITGDKDATLGTKIYDWLHDEHGNNKIAKFFGFSGNDEPKPAVPQPKNTIQPISRTDYRKVREMLKESKSHSSTIDQAVKQATATNTTSETNNIQAEHDSYTSRDAITIKRESDKAVEKLEQNVKESKSRDRELKEKTAQPTVVTIPAPSAPQTSHADATVSPPTFTRTSDSPLRRVSESLILASLG